MVESNSTAIVLYKTSGAAADQSLEERIFQIGTFTLRINQQPKQSKSLRHQACSPSQVPGQVEEECVGSNARLAEAGPAGREAAEEAGKHLDHVGLVVWQSAFVLAELLLQRPPWGTWVGVKCVDLGTGTGVLGIALAMAGADVVLTDMPHILPLTQRNLLHNMAQCVHSTRVVALPWGPDVEEVIQGGEWRPDLITGADVVYQRQHFPALLDCITALSAPHTVTFLSFKVRGRGEAEFQELAASRGFAIETVPSSQLHEEYRDGFYQVLRLALIDAAPMDQG